MKHRLLGRTELRVSEVAFGGVEIGMPYGIGTAGKTEMPEESAAIDLLREAVKQGVNFFDTARLYGDSERLMGVAFEEIRSEIVLATKCIHFRNSLGNIPCYDELKTIVHQSLEQSLTSLRTDYIDVFMVHYADLDILNNHDVARIFLDLKNQGRVRNIGVSVYRAEESLLAVESGIWDVVQLPFNLMDQSHAICFDQAKEKGIAIIVRSVLMRGLLTDRIFPMDSALQSVANHIAMLREIAGHHFDSFAAYATKFALRYEQVSSVLVGIDKEKFLLAAIANVSGQGLNDQIFADSKKLAYPSPECLNLAEWDKKGWL